MALLPQSWEQYLEGRRNGDPNFEVARQLLTHHYEEIDLPNHVPSSGTPREVARYEAENTFFSCEDAESQGEVEALLQKIVEQRYRENPGDANENNPPVVNLIEMPARRFIAAERLFQRKLIMLAGAGAQTFHVGLHTGIDVGHWEYIKQDKGPPESYRVQASTEENITIIRLYHKSESKDTSDGYRSCRLGFKWVYGVGYYSEIFDNLTKILSQLENDRGKLVWMFKEMCRRHSVSPELLQTIEDGNLFLRTCFHILINEQSQWHSACFIEGNVWKFGMIVSFARLIKLFEDGHIDLNQLFFGYPIYMFKDMFFKERHVRFYCNEIDTLYQDRYPEITLDQDQALNDLIYLYGDRF